jgi:hypothetical protein
MPENVVPALEQLRELAQRLDGECEVWLGGFAAQQLAPADIPRGCVLLPSTQDFEQRLDLLSARHYS